MQTTSEPNLDDDTASIAIPYSSPWSTVISELPDADPVSDAERRSDITASKMHLWWREGSGYSGYRDVAVLLVKWAEHLDQLKCGDEVRDLDELFQNSFKYHTKIVQLHDKCNANLQLHSAFVDFIKQYDGPNNLLIVYYTGHGSQMIDTGHLLLHPTDRPMAHGCSTQSPDLARAVWEQAEVHLMQNAKCDALSILDCCFAGDVHKSGFQEDDRTYQLLSAAGKGKLTRRPGPYSFTRALINCLTELQKEYGDNPFTTLQLQERIHNRPERRNNPPVLWHRLHRYERPICLAPLIEQTKSSLPVVSEPSRAFLTLRLALEEESLNKDQVTTLGSKITKAAKSAGAKVRRVDMMSFSVASRKRSLSQMIRNTTIPSMRFRHGVRSDTRPTQIDLDPRQLPTTPVSQSDSSANKVSHIRRGSDGRIGQAQSGHTPRPPSPGTFRKRRRTSESDVMSKKRWSSM
ncbi:MAG: Phosphatidylinositol-4-phosphate 5-kinase [Bogoriella megaspora]|nr:MAG: Phosphatidylinositol-4-phosphate 5-kinase [Bogoriella megaspora]